MSTIRFRGITAGFRAATERVRERPAPVVAWVATFSLTFLTTIGPVYSVRLGMGPLTSDFVDDVTIQVFFAGFYAVLFAALARFGPYPKVPRLLKLLLAGFCVAAMGSTLLSVDQARTATQAFLLTMTAAAGLCIGRATTVPSQVTALFASQQLGAALSIVAILRKAPRAVDPEGRWVGIYLIRNSLGPVAALGLIATVGCAYLLWKRYRSWPTTAVVGAVVCLGLAAAMDIALLNRSEALTPALALLVVTLGVGALVALRRFSREPRRAAVRNAAVTLAGIVSTTVVLWAARGTVLGWVGQSTTLDGRASLWDYLWELTTQRPVRGWGWQAVWRVVDPSRTNGLGSAHNGFLEVYLGIGLLGLGLIVAFCLVLLWLTTRNAASSGGIALWPFALVLYALTANQLESFIGGNLLPWVLLTMVAARAGQHQDQLIQDRAAFAASKPERAPDPNCL